ncbi:MAG TPA: type II secretion system protein GspC [Kofleriaceae bacterium]|nr:type II secretion system protein GspC [Kofleriaceae bacterium]
MRALIYIATIAAAACGGSGNAAEPSRADVKTFAWKPQHAGALAIVRRTTENLEHDPTGPRPDWVLYDPKHDQVVFVGAEVGYRRALSIAQSYDVEPPKRPDPPAIPDVTMNPFSSPSAAPAPAPALPGIKQVDDTDFTIERSMLDTLLSDPAQMSRAVRIIPSIKNGQPDGLKLYAIRPTSPIAALGFMNGDTIHSINGLDLNSADKALDAYSRLKTQSSFDVAITRRGRALVLHYSIK